MVIVKCVGDIEFGFDVYDLMLYVFEGIGCWLVVV